MSKYRGTGIYCLLFRQMMSPTFFRTKERDRNGRKGKNVLFIVLRKDFGLIIFHHYADQITKTCEIVCTHMAERQIPTFINVTYDWRGEEARYRLHTYSRIERLCFHISVDVVVDDSFGLEYTV